MGDIIPLLLVLLWKHIIYIYIEAIVISLLTVIRVEISSSDVSMVTSSLLITLAINEPPVTMTTNMLTGFCGTIIKLVFDHSQYLLVTFPTTEQNDLVKSMRFVTLTVNAIALTTIPSSCSSIYQYNIITITLLSWLLCTACDVLMLVTANP